MLFFLDESWQVTGDGKYKIGVLSAIQLKSHDFNETSKQMGDLKIQHLGYTARDTEIKGMHIFRDYLFRLEKKGIRSRELDLARGIFKLMQAVGVQIFASIVFSKEEADLACANVNQLERPFFFLFERIDLFMKENYPGLMAKLIFDDRNTRFNENLSKSVSNFFHKCSVGQTFDNIIKVPFFAISTENIGIQMADMTAHIIGAKFTGNRNKEEFFSLAKKMEFKSRTPHESDGRRYEVSGLKVIKQKEAGDLFNPGRVK